ncbi:hypothetical protein Y032_0760g2121 [Ancylostoma ceylanicum]|uniref:Uncharacterized protein n=1 Tax=Ancylostoma ceylanicum TaxID=53326 RepID=A0A016WDZ9_9BILA|nr:hypothetical protein Y032_0760g2121 [Ancylostoma ceylanicum]
MTQCPKWNTDEIASHVDATTNESTDRRFITAIRKNNILQKARGKQRKWCKTHADALGCRFSSSQSPFTTDRNLFRLN